MLNDSSYGPSVHLSWREVAVDDPECQAVLSVRLKASKTDPFRKGIKGKGLEDYHSNIGPLEELGISGVHPHPKTTAGKLLSSAVLMLPAPTNGCIVAGHYSYSVCTLLVPPFVCHYVFLLHCISFEILSVLR